MKKKQMNKHVRQETQGIMSQVLKFLAIAFVAFILLLVGNILWKDTRIPANFVPQVQGAPSIAVISEPVIQHGDLIVNRFVTSSFEIQNVGDEVLIIPSLWVQVHEGCCPPEAVISKQSLQPGEIATVSMRYTMHAGMDGPHDLRIHLRSNDPNNPESNLPLFPIGLVVKSKFSI